MKDLEQLVRYLDGDLSDNERQQIDDRLKIDPSFSGKLDLIKDVDNILGDKELSSFEQRLSEIEKRYRNKESLEEPLPTYEKPIPVYNTSKFNIRRIAAVIAILVAFTFSVIWIKNTFWESKNDLFATYYQKMPADFGTRSEESTDNEFIRAIKLYNQNNYKEAIIAFERVLKKDPSNNAAKLFLGISYTETRQYKNAANQFTNIIQGKDPIFEEHASWYLSLCYLKTNNPGLAKNILQILVNTNSFYKDKASDLLKKLQ
jgi:tetratricopeptide (TPR) repeat protein